MVQVPAQQPTGDIQLRPATPPPVLRTAGQLGLYNRPGEEDTDFYIQIELPGPQRLFRRESERQLYQRLKLEGETRAGNIKVIFPEYPPVTREPFTPRILPRQVKLVEPSYVCHGRLHFEQLNFDRYGWEIGYLQPGISTALFLYDVALLPYHTWTRPCERWDCSAGKCQPGDCTPLRLYPEEFSISGLAAQATVLGFGYFIFP